MEIYKNYSLENLDGEEWRDVEGYEGLYQVSNMGRIKSLGRKVKNISLKRGYRETKDKILKQSIDRYGYLKVALNKESQKNYFTVHRLVALAFIDNPLNKPSVDHKNTIRTDNRVENLRWFTYKEQLNDNELSKIRHLEAREKATNSLKKRVRCITTGEEFECINDASRKYNIDDSSIAKCCKGKRTYTKTKTEPKQKLQWEYVD